MKDPFSATALAFAVSVTATASTGAALGSAPQSGSLNTIRLVNEGPNRCYIALGAAAVAATVPTGTAAATATPILPGSDIILTVSSAQTHISAICRASETATLIVCGAGEGV